MASRAKRTPPDRSRFYRPPRACDVGWWRVLTSPLRRLPGFLVIGTQRGGTTSLYEYLCRHPRLAPATEKEVHYFDFQHARGSAWYRAHFPLWRPGRHLTGEASPFYLFHPRVPALVRAALPQAKLIVLLRDPVERAHSHYRLQRQAKIEPLLTFEEALAAEPARLAGEADKLATRAGYYSYNFQHYSYLARGVYHEQLAAWFGHFAREQFLVVPSEEFYAEPAAVFAQVCGFLGLPVHSAAAADPPRLNHQPGGEMLAATRRQLRAYYAPYNAALFHLLGTSYAWPTSD